MKGLGLIAVIVVLWLLLRKKSGAQPPVTAGADLPPDPTRTRAPGVPLIGTGAGNNNALDSFAQAIFQQEGTQAGNLSVRNNNPGNLKNTSGQFQQFADQGDGWDALNSYITRHAQANPQWDFYDFFQNYLGQPQGGPAVTSQGNSDQYAEYVAGYLGVDPTTPVSSVLNGG